MKKNTIFTTWILLLLVSLSSCIKNDIPFPTIPLFITEFAVEGQLGASIIDDKARTVTLTLGEQAIASEQVLTSFAVTQDAHSPVTLGDTINLSDTLVIDLKLYQDYPWRIIAKQPIARVFTMKNQVGEAAFDAQARRAVAYVTPTTNLRLIDLDSLKLAPIGATYSPDLLTKPVDFRTVPVEVDVTYRGEVQTWQLFVEHKAQLVTTKTVDPWVTSLYAYGDGVESSNKGFEYREASQSEWIRVSESEVVTEGSSFYARIAGLAPEQTYYVRAYLDANLGNEVEATTLPATQLPNGSLNDWSLEKKKIWNPWLETGVSFFDTGNPGASTLGKSNVQPTDDTFDGTGKAAQLESRFVGIASIGKFAAASIFAGEFVAVDGTNGILNFGRPFTTYPASVTLRYKFDPKPINYASADLSILKGRPDSCFIYAALGDWDDPVEIRTNPKNQKLFSTTDPNIIAYGEFTSGDLQAEYKELTIDLEYRAINRRPTYLVFVASASKYGDYFTGGQGTMLYLDEIVLNY